jgi:hypothetical protein
LWYFIDGGSTIQFAYGDILLIILNGPCYLLLTGGCLVTDGRVTEDFQKEKMRSNNSNDGNYLLLWGFF